MKDILSFIDQCEFLTNGQPIAEIIRKAAALIREPQYWCGRHTACILHEAKLSDGTQYQWCSPCRINHPRAMRLNIEGAVGRACNNEGIIPPHLLRYLDESVLYYLRMRGVTGLEEEAGAWSPYDVGWFGEFYGHDHALGLLDEIYERLKP